MSFQKLPSIQFLLNENHACKSSHASINKISNLPSELQLLSLSAPATRIEQHQPSWMLPRKSPSSSHSRSISDLPSLPPTNHKRYQAHRRTMSAIATTDTPPIQNYPIRARTVSPPHEDQPKASQKIFKAMAISHSNPTVFLTQINGLINNDKDKTKMIEYENLMVARDEETGRYYCPFCNKPFNRPSSLRIHTYSHTGEKPFICQEKGCGRQFSVQSNMRRHQRVHKRSSSNKHLSK
ncbi:Zinc finger protein C25B8.19c [Choanephora cucurbitarum]|uniref:Zinc finger protein C25B8.19c n=1 Tax=Choanephora cucurbitarum TaxID=101091 RepID=A0A1C7NKQ4_9FUNG|nr:Zinc finger protein C25B8.19c [Choanephora cucurbitarum]